MFSLVPGESSALVLGFTGNPGRTGDFLREGVVVPGLSATNYAFSQEVTRSPWVLGGYLT
jgi:hypothetical protein